MDAQLAAGLVEETRRLLAQGYDRHLGSMKGLGYRQISGYLAGDTPMKRRCGCLNGIHAILPNVSTHGSERSPGIVWVQMEE